MITVHIIKKATPKGSVMLVATQPPEGKTFPNQFKKSSSLFGKQGRKSVDCYSRPENAHKKPGFSANKKALTTTTPTPVKTCNYRHRTGHLEKQRFKKNAEGKTNDQDAVLFMVTEHGFLTKGPSHTFPNKTFIANSGATCHFRGTLEGMFDLKPYFTDITVANNKTMASVSKGQYNGIFLQKYGTSVDITLQDLLSFPKLTVNLCSLTKAIEITGVTLSSKEQIIFNCWKH
jgi:hypothetical protein